MPASTPKRESPPTIAAKEAPGWQMFLGVKSSTVSFTSEEVLHIFLVKKYLNLNVEILRRANSVRHEIRVGRGDDGTGAGRETGRKTRSWLARWPGPRNGRGVVGGSMGSSGRREEMESTGSRGRMGVRRGIGRRQVPTLRNGQRPGGKSTGRQVDQNYHRTYY